MDFKEKLENIRKEYLSKQEQVFFEFIDVLKNNNIKYITIETYTPGFNDGDPCEHTIGNIYINGFDEYEDMDEEDDSIVHDEKYMVDKKTHSEVASVIYELKHYLHKMYDTNVRIKIDTLNKIVSTEEYDYGF